MIIEIISIIFSFLWIYLLFWIGQGKKQLLFYLLLYLPYIFMIVPLFIFPSIFITIVTTLSSWFLIIIIAMIGERILWGMSLKDASGQDKLVWFYLIFFFPLIGWMAYWGTQ